MSGKIQVNVIKASRRLETLNQTHDECDGEEGEIRTGSAHQHYISHNWGENIVFVLYSVTKLSKQTLVLLKKRKKCVE